MEASGTKIDQLLKACARLQGHRRVRMEDITYGPSICPHCGQGIKPEGQEALNAMATVEGIYFRCKVPCSCKCSLGFVQIDVDREVQGDEACPPK